MSKNTKTSWKGPASRLTSRHLWILCLFPVAKINTRSPNVAHNLVESSRGWGGGSGVGPAENASPSFAAFCDSRKTLEKMAQPSHPCLKPGLHNRQFFFVSSSFLSTRVSRPCLRPKTRLTARRYSMSIGCSLCYQCLYAKSVLRSHFCLLNEGW